MVSRLLLQTQYLWADESPEGPRHRGRYLPVLGEKGPHRRKTLWEGRTDVTLRKGIRRMVVVDVR